MELSEVGGVLLMYCPRRSAGGLLCGLFTAWRKQVTCGLRGHLPAWIMIYKLPVSAAYYTQYMLHITACIERTCCMRLQHMSDVYILLPYIVECNVVGVKHRSSTTAHAVVYYMRIDGVLSWLLRVCANETKF